ncbi:CRISPR-associated helicase/endonuclease Cas3 [Thermomonas brevis]
MSSALEQATETALHRYWGKADPALGEHAWHPLVFHSLDVAAVAHRYLEARPRLLARMAAWFGLDPESALALICALVALHDLGKFGENFQCKREDLFAVGFPDRVGCVQSKCSTRHDHAGAVFAGGAMPRILGENWPLGDAFRSLLTACCGHHGTPVSSRGLADDAMTGQAQADAARWIRETFALFRVNADTLRKLAEAPPPAIHVASWWLAGLTVLADWVGSNTDWFGYATDEQRIWPLGRYWNEIAFGRAENALHAARLMPQPAAPWRNLAALFPALAEATPSPAQQLCSSMPLGDAAQLFLLEEATGAGKTEAALILAHRLMDRGLGDGLYFGLPTQATSDQMYERMDDVGPRLYAEGADPAILLAHGQRNQNPRFRARTRPSGRPESGDAAETASQQAQQWLTQGSKRTLLGHVGVGTIDQMQMAGLRVKHQPLRLLGLFDKILIVDEVHAYDRYMQAVLCNVLKAHAAAGGSAILLSATLPRADRQTLFTAFAEGRALAEAASASGALARLAQRRTRAIPEPAVKPPMSLEYPLLTHYRSGGAACTELRIDESPRSRRRVRIDYRARQEDIDALLLEAHGTGRAACWIRNSVTEAVEACQRLSALLPSGSVTLFHSRFALDDRLCIQNDVLRRFGRDSDAAARAGRIVIATQVIEQSLDLDFDLMVSDLAPIDVLLQRQGRLMRHLRDAMGNRIASGSDGRGEPVLVVFGPDRNAEPDRRWLSRHSRASGLIYRAHGQSWLTAQVIGDELILPRDFRDKVEAVYGSDAQPPDCFDDAQAKAAADGYSERGIAERNCTDWREGYRAGLDWQDDERIPTRLGDSIEAVLLELRDGDLHPLAPPGMDDSGEYERLARSGIRLPEHWNIRHDALPVDENASQLVRSWRARLPGMKHRLPIVLLEGSAVMRNPDGRNIGLRYDSNTGLQRID